MHWRLLWPVNLEFSRAKGYDHLGGGENIYCVEVENVFYAHSKVLEAQINMSGTCSLSQTYALQKENVTPQSQVQLDRSGFPSETLKLGINLSI
jgi:hypothetical protein